MFASNENGDWIYLVKTPPVNTTIVQSGAMNFVADVKSEANVALSTTELEQAQDDDITILSEESPTPILDQNYVNESMLSPSIDQQIRTVLNDNHVLNTAFELSKTPCDSINSIRSPTVTKSVQTDIRQSTSILRKHTDRHTHKTDTLVSSTCLIVLVTFSFILGQMVTQWDQPTMNKIAQELVKTNQRLNEIKEIPIHNLEQKLTKQLEDKLKAMINKQLNFLTQIHDLQETLNKTQENMTKTIGQLTKENSELKEQVKFIEHRFDTTQKASQSESRLTNSSKFMTDILRQTATSINLSNFFENLSASVSRLIDHRHEYFRKSTEKLNNLTRLTQRKSFSIPIRQVKFTYPSWIQSRQQTRRKLPWRWSISSRKQPSCSSHSSYPINKICSMKNWMLKFFQS